jgi:hypothetical protein
MMATALSLVIKAINGLKRQEEANPKPEVPAASNSSWKYVTFSPRGNEN